MSRRKDQDKQDKPGPVKSGLPTWAGLPPYTKPDDDAICGELLEDGSGWCTATVRDHIEEFRRIVSRPGTVLSRPSQREAARTAPPTEAQIEARRQFLAQQAAQIRQKLTDDTVSL